MPLNIIFAYNIMRFEINFNGVHMENIKKISVLAPAKINLFLGVRSRREDGYHDIESVMQTIDLCDKVNVFADMEAQDNSIAVSCRNSAEDINGEKNIAYRAAKAFLEAAGIENFNITIDIEKKIPMEAGLGGGSSDAAAVIHALDIIYETKMTESDLCAIGAKIGADVPFLIRRGTAYVEGIGEVLSDCTPSPSATLVIAYPNSEKVCTKEAYAKIDDMKIFSNSEDFENMKNAMRSCDMNEIAKVSYNVFEEILPERSEVFILKNIMKENGAVLSLMSGSGSAVFGVFDDARSAKRAREALCGISQTFIAGMFTRDESYMAN